MKRLSTFSIFLLLLFGCSPTEQNDDVQLYLEMRGDMLFEGSNTLQMPSVTSLEALAKEAGTEVSKLKKIGVRGAAIQINGEYAAITESLLLQVVSDNKSLVTVGTLSPLSEDEEQRLSHAEDVDLLPYLKDPGATWVLDLNISEDHMDELYIEGTVQLSISYTP